MFSKFKLRASNATNKKVQGINSMITSMFALTLMSVISIFFLDTAIEISTKAQVEQVTRGYVILMEAKGSLSEANKEELTRRIENINLVKPGSVEISPTPTLSSNRSVWITVSCEVAVTGVKAGAFMELTPTYSPLTLTVYSTTKTSLKKS